MQKDLGDRQLQELIFKAFQKSKELAMTPERLERIVAMRESNRKQMKRVKAAVKAANELNEMDEKALARENRRIQRMLNEPQEPACSKMMIIAGTVLLSIGVGFAVVTFFGNQKDEKQE